MSIKRTAPKADPTLKALVADVQFNADLSDARYAQSAPLCIYLLDLREFYRWQHDLSPGAVLRRKDLGPWIGVREAQWDALREADVPHVQAYRAPLPTLSADPYETDALRDHLAAQGLAYGAGIGRYGRPQFFLAQVLAIEQRDDCTITICGKELARGVTAPPAMSRGREVVIRQDAFERWLWARFEEWQLHPRDNGFGIAWNLHAEALGVSGDDAPGAVARRMALTERESLILHELGERRIDAQLGEPWHDLIDALASRKAELLARSVRDLLADCTLTLPALLARGESTSIHFWFGLLDGFRQKLAPGMVDDYRRWCRGESFAWADRLAEAAAHWQLAAATVQAVWAEEGEEGFERLLAEDRLAFR